MSYAIDTAATIADLEAAGVAPAHAKAIVQAINGAAGDPVSKDDFKDLRGEFKELRGDFNDLRGEFNGLRGEFNGLRGEFKDLRGDFNDLRGEFNDLRGEFNGLRGEFNDLRDEFNDLRDEVKAENKAMRDEFNAKFATKADVEMLKSTLTARIVWTQLGTVTLLFAMLKVFG